MTSSGMLRRVALVRTDVSEELSALFIRVTRIDELATTLAVTSNRRTVRRYRRYVPEAVSPEVKGQKLEAECLPPASAVIKKTWIYKALLHSHSWHTA
jgi:hypothetical protein